MVMSRHPNRIQPHNLVVRSLGGEALEIEKVKTVNNLGVQIAEDGGRKKKRKLDL